MGQTPKPLRIAVTDPGMLAWPEVVELREKGHFIDTLMAVSDPDLVIGPQAWHLTEAHRAYLPLAITQATKATVDWMERRAARKAAQKGNVGEK